jgi:hypothetical protein
MNCDHSENGWCLDCVKRLHDEKKLAESLIALAPKYQHTATELRYVADILDVLNNALKVGHDCAVDGELEVFWCDDVMGVISLDDSQDMKSWVYFPSACETYEAT